MMRYRVKQHEQKSLEVKIKNLLKENERTENIQKKLLDMYENRTNYTDLSQDEVDSVFGNWLKETDSSLIGVKKTIVNIKKMMFEDNKK